MSDFQAKMHQMAICVKIIIILVTSCH